ncbi:MAG: FmdB family transcriptional regulator [Deltaproteobacteria bacterium]|nr:FmdB family transcriptional regulator [Deltaproteobacteria bacterium]
MPTYAYDCKQCGVIEIKQSINDTPLLICPNCKGEIKRIIAGHTNFSIKGRSSQVNQCGNTKPCCGRDYRCDKSPCNK